MRAHLPIVGVMGSGVDPHVERAVALGRALARLPVHLLTGGGGGVMSAVSRAFTEVPNRAGLVIGVLPSAGEPGGPGDPGARRGYPNAWVELPIRTHLPLSGARGDDPLSRNHINVLSSDAVVALPGGAGTASEVRLALRYGRPVVAFLGTPEAIPGLPPEVPVHAELAPVLAFVRASLERG